MGQYSLGSILDSYNYFVLVGILSLFLFVRFLIISYAYHYFFFKLFQKRYEKKFVNRPSLTGKQAKTELIRSALGSFIFSVVTIFFLQLWNKGYLTVVTDWSEYSVFYHIFSLIAVLFLHETYFYWIHRWMHFPKVYRLVHKWHHDSIETSSLTAFAFHPIEAAFQAVIIPLILLIIPVHVYVLLAVLIIMTVSATINHASVEIYPDGFEKHWLGKWFIGSTHHDHHHKRFRYNYGLYFTFWDKWMDTETDFFKNPK